MQFIVPFAHPSEELVPDFDATDDAAVACEVAKDGFEATGCKSRLFHELEYAARSRRRRPVSTSVR